MLLWWTKRSLLPSSGVMKPKPFSSLNHLTVPCAMYFLHGVLRAASAVVAQRQPSASACTAFAGRVPGPNFAHRTTVVGWRVNFAIARSPGAETPLVRFGQWQNVTPPSLEP